MSRTKLRYPEGTETVGTARVREPIVTPMTAAQRAIYKLTGNPPQSSALDEPIDPLDPFAFAPPVPAKAKKKPKYGNQKCESGGIKFDSKAEMKRWHELVQMQARGEIFDLELQVPFVLEPAAIVGGKKVKARVYIADFVYEDSTGKQVVEDVKGVKTAIYSYKKHQMKTHLNIDIVEITK